MIRRRCKICKNFMKDHGEDYDYTCDTCKEKVNNQQNSRITIFAEHNPFWCDDTTCKLNKNEECMHANPEMIGIQGGKIKCLTREE